MITAPNLAEAIDLALNGQNSMVRCTVHPDDVASVHVSPGHTQPVIIKCHAGCETDDLLYEEGIDLDTIMADRPADQSADQPTRPDVWTPAGPASHIYDYTDEEGTVLFQVCRIPLPGGKKTFRQRHADPDRPGKHIWNMDGVRRVLYQLPEVIAAKNEGRVVWLVEGEKDVDNLRAIGETATTSPMGAGKWDPEFSTVLAGATVKIIADKDATGQAHARVVAESLTEVGAHVAVYEAAGQHKDVSDHLAAGLGLVDLLETAPDARETEHTYGVDILDAVNRTFEAKAWVIPDTLVEGERLLITGFEGHGKSTLIQQIAVQVAAGIHPFNGRTFDPRRVLVLDCENRPDQMLEKWQHLAGLAARHDRPLERGMLTILEAWDSEVDLTTQWGRQWLLERVHAYKPQLMCIGPLYNMSGRDLKDDETVRKIKKVVNEACGLYGTAFIMEHHAPHKGPNDSKRSVRPYGSSTFLKWPDFGYGLMPMEKEGLYEFQKTRFPRVRSREYPDHLRWGKQNSMEWMWMPAFEDAEGQAN